MIQKTTLLVFISILHATTLADEAKPDLNSLFYSLKYQNLTMYEASRKITEYEFDEGIKLGVFKVADEHYFNSCGKSCLDKLNELKIPLEKNNQKVTYRVEVLYEDFELTKPIAELIGTEPLLLRLKNSLFTIAEAPENYLLAYPEYKDEQYAHLLPTTIPFIKPYLSQKYRYKAGGAIWFKEIKKFAYYYKNSAFLNPTLMADTDIIENRCQKNLHKGFRGNPKLYDDSNKLIPPELVKKLFVLGYKFEGEYIRFYFASEEKISNLIDGVKIIPNYLVSYFKLHDKHSYRLKKSDLIDENGEIVYFQGDHTTGDSVVNCPFELPKEYESKLQKKEMKFSDLPEKFWTNEYTGNIQFLCRNRSLLCKNEKDDSVGKKHYNPKTFETQ